MNYSFLICSIIDIIVCRSSTSVVVGVLVVVQGDVSWLLLIASLLLEIFVSTCSRVGIDITVILLPTTIGAGVPLLEFETCTDNGHDDEQRGDRKHNADKS